MMFYSALHGAEAFKAFLRASIDTIDAGTA